MKNVYQCKVCFETFSLLRYLRKHVTIPDAGDHNPNKCQIYYSRTGNLQGNLQVNHKIVTEKIPTEEINSNANGQQVQLVFTNDHQKSNYSKDENCTNIEDELACLKFEPDAEDELYFFERETQVLSYNDTFNKSPHASVNNEDRTKKDNQETIVIVDEEQNKAQIQRTATFQNSQNPRIGVDILEVNTTGVSSLAKSTSCRDSTNRKFKCDKCPKQFSCARNLRFHKESVHEGVRYTCELCEKEFSREKNLKRHIASRHNGIRYKCELCEKQFRYKQNLKEHKASSHSGIRYKCDMCGKEFSRRESLKPHKAISHEGRIRYKCDICEKEFSRSENLNLHRQRSHEGIRYKCDMCEKQFRQRTNLKEHKSSQHDGVRYKCDICPKEYSLMTNLRQHKSVKHGSKQVRN